MNESNPTAPRDLLSAFFFFFVELTTLACCSAFHALILLCVSSSAFFWASLAAESTGGLNGARPPKGLGELTPFSPVGDRRGFGTWIGGEGGVMNGGEDSLLWVRPVPRKVLLHTYHLDV